MAYGTSGGHRLASSCCHPGESSKIFRYLDDLDCFVVSEEYQRLADQLGLTEWSPVVWIGRLFTLDNDYGEHWFDNWHLREPLEEAAAQRGLSRSC